MEFCSEYANVKYIKEDNIVLLTWKQPAYLENYRKPTELALEMLRSNEGSNLVIDARNGFEDAKSDVEWGFNYLLPEMAKTSCRFVCFIMNQVNEIEDEIDMWTMEFGKYFAVIRAEDYKTAKNSMRSYILANVRYSIKDGKREEFVEKLSEMKISDASRQEPGNLRYELNLPVDASNDVCLIEMWTNWKEQKRHRSTKHYDLLSELKSKYVEKVDICCYKVEEMLEP